MPLRQFLFGPMMAALRGLFGGVVVVVSTNVWCLLRWRYQCCNTKTDRKSCKYFEKTRFLFFCGHWRRWWTLRRISRGRNWRSRLFDVRSTEYFRWIITVKYPLTLGALVTLLDFADPVCDFLAVLPVLVVGCVVFGLSRWKVPRSRSNSYGEP